MAEPQSKEDINATPQLERDPVSAFVVCFNEEAHIGECLDSLAFCDEVLVIDSFSTDQTVEIAKRCGAKVVQRAWKGYRDQKSFGLSAVEHDWVLNIDADERISPELQVEILRILKEERELDRKGVPIDHRVSGYYLNRLIYYLGRWWRRGGWYPEFRMRFFRKAAASWGGQEPHERAIVTGKTERLSGDIYHFTYRNLEDQLTRLQHFATIAAEEAYARGKRSSVVALALNPILRFCKFYFFKRGIVEGTAGFVIAVTEAYYTFMKYAKLWELEFVEKLGERASRPE